MSRFQLIFDRRYFRLFFIFVVFLNTLSLRFFGIGRNPLYPLVFMWSFIIFIYDIYKGRWKKTRVGPLVIYGLALIIATFANNTYSTLDSYQLAFLQLIIFWMVFMNPRERSLISIKNEIRLVIPWVSVLTFIASAISLAMFFLNISLTRNGMTIGLVGDRLFGIYFNCNPAAFLACISMVLSLWAFRNRFNFRYFYVLNGITQLLYIILTGCRSAVLILSFYSVLVLYYTLFKKRGFSTLKRWMLGIMTVLMIIFGSNLTQKTLFIIPKLQGAVAQVESRFQFEKIEQMLLLLGENPLGNLKEVAKIADEVSSGRIELVYDSIKIWKTSPLLGVGANNFRAIGLDVDPDSSVLQGEQVVHSHNIFLESLVTAGIAGFVSFLLFFVQSVFNFWESLKKYSGTSSYFVILLCLLIVVTEFIGGMFDYGVFYVYSLSATLGWMFLGYVFWINDHPVYQLTNSSVYYDFMSYDLCQINYLREKDDKLQNVWIKIVDYLFTEDEQLVQLEMMVNLKFDSHTSYFTYVGNFKLLKIFPDDKMEKIICHMAMELYALVADDIISLTSDSQPTLSIPAEATIRMVKYAVK